MIEKEEEEKKKNFICACVLSPSKKPKLVLMYRRSRKYTGENS